jgi:predicted phage tail protein
MLTRNIEGLEALQALQAKVEGIQQQVKEHDAQIKTNKKAIQDSSYIRNKFKLEESITRGQIIT